VFNDETDFRAIRREWEELVRRDRQMLPTERLILLHLASFAGCDRFAWPSAKTLADEIGVSVATAKRALRRGRERGWIMRNRKRNFGGSMEYRLSAHGAVVHEIKTRKKTEIAVRRIRRNSLKRTPLIGVTHDTIGDGADPPNGLTGDTPIGSPMTHNPLLRTLTLNPVKKGSTEQEEALGVEPPDGDLANRKKIGASDLDDDLANWRRLGAGGNAALVDRSTVTPKATSAWSPPADPNQPDLFSAIDAENPPAGIPKDVSEMFEALALDVAGQGFKRYSSNAVIIFRAPRSCGAEQGGLNGE
jgi:DNA-binding MarR family transcriptional regulator